MVTFRLSLNRISSPLSAPILLLITYILGYGFYRYMLVETNLFLPTNILLMIFVGYVAVFLHEWAHVFLFRIFRGRSEPTVFYLNFVPSALTPVPGLFQLAMWKQRIVIAGGLVVDFLFLIWGITLLSLENQTAYIIIIPATILVLRDLFLPNSDGHQLLMTLFEE
ncbi:MAG: hypothetical protein AAF490_30220 [Chloroflexota bacterium]